ncbi:MAG: VanZ family protein [Clostridia bacterium]|nr:VanZ family protein [Clostridia bacterium]
MKRILEKLRRAITPDRAILLAGALLLLFYLFLEILVRIDSAYRVNPILRAIGTLLVCIVFYCGGRLHLERTKNKRLFRALFILFFVLYLNLIFTVTLMDVSLGRTGDFIFNNVIFKDQRAHYLKWFVNLVPFQSIYEVYIQGYLDGNVTLYYVTLNLLGNLCLFMPLAVFLPLFFKHQRRWYFFVPTVIFATAAIEALQYFFMVGSCDVDDLILNATGAILVFFLLKIPAVKRLCTRLLADAFH